MWNANNGKPERLFSADFNNEITAICFDRSHRRVFAGDGDGAIKTFDTVTGICIHEFDQQNGEITYLNYNCLDRTLLAVSRNKELRIYKDFKKVEDGEREILRTIKMAHTWEISCSDYNLYQNLIATGSVDGVIKIWYFSYPDKIK